MSFYRIGIVGAGMIATIHKQAIDLLENAEVAGVMDNGSGRGLGIAPGTDPRGAGDIDQFLEREDIDIITIATPSGAHRDIAIKAAQRGRHCIVEKPIEITLPRIDAMIDAHERAGTLLGGIFNSRYGASALAMKQAALAERFGQISYAGVVGPWWREPSYYSESNWKGTLALDGGGALMNQGIHSVDLLQWLVGVPVSSVSGYTARRAHPQIEVEDTAAATLRFANGAIGSIAATTSVWPGQYRTLTIGGSEGTAALADNQLFAWQFRSESSHDRVLRQKLLGVPGEGIGASDPAAGMVADGHKAVFAEFLAALEQGRQPSVDGYEARKAVELVLAIYQSAAAGGSAVTLPCS